MQCCKQQIFIFIPEFRKLSGKDTKVHVIAFKLIKLNLYVGMNLSHITFSVC